jgi:hypothetical protein
MADKEARLGTRFDHPAVFQSEVSLHRSGHADPVLTTGLSNGRDSIPRTKGSAFDQFGEAPRDPDVKRFTLY